jgi:hypothetical protein
MTERQFPTGGLSQEADNGLAGQLARLDQAQARLMASISHETTEPAPADPDQAEPRRERRWLRRARTR